MQQLLHPWVQPSITKKVTSKLLQTSKSTKKMYKIDDHIAWAVVGIMSDANILINTATVQALCYTFAYQLELAEVFLSPSGEATYRVCPPETLDELLVKSGVTQPVAESS